MESEEVGYDLKKIGTEVIEYFRLKYQQLGIRVKDVYALCGISKQAHAQAILRMKKIQNNEPLYIGLMYEIRDLHPGMGLRTMYEQFQPEGMGRDAFIELGLKEGLRLRVIVNPVKTTKSVKSSRYPNLLVGKRFTGVNQIWASDLFYFSVEGKHQYVVLIMDVYSRRIIGYNAAENMRAENNVRALHTALTLRGIDDYDGKLIHHSDRGSQYISEAYTELLEQYGIQISMCTDVLENAHMERANGTIKNDYLARYDVQSAAALPMWLHKAVNAYNNRIHQSLDRKTPAAFETLIKELDEKERPVLEIFTINKLEEDPNQLSLFPGL